MVGSSKPPIWIQSRFDDIEVFQRGAKHGLESQHAGPICRFALSLIRLTIGERETLSSGDPFREVVRVFPAKGCRATTRISASELIP